MRKRNNLFFNYINKSPHILGALICTFLFPVFSFSQTHNDTILTNSIDTIIVKARKKQGNDFINREKIERVPSLLGENDILKYLATLPGIVSINALDPGIYVRGGNSMENAYLVNDIEIANPNHLTGILSVFDPYVLGNSSFYKSGYPARYNNYLSSYINMHPLIGDKEQIKGEVTAGLLSSAVKLQGPICNENHSFVVSARTSYLQHVARIYNKANDGESMPSYGFSDITMNLHSKLSEKWNINLFGLYTSDKLDIDLVRHDIQHALQWSSFSSSFKINYIRENSLLSFTGGVNISDTEGETGGHTRITMDNRYINWSGNIHYTKMLNPYIHYHVGTGASTSSYNLDYQGNIKFDLYKLYGGINFSFIENLTLDAGLNFQHYKGEATSSDFSPRLKLNYQWKAFNFWADYAKTIQYTTLYPYFTLKSPVDMHYPLVAGYKPASSHHYSLGTDVEINDYISVYGALFLKKMYHLKDFLSNVKSIKENLAELFTEGEGTAKGIELDAVYDRQNLYIRAAYTFSESVRNFKEINNGNDFHPPFDMKHNFLLSTSWHISSRWCLNAMWTYFSGGYATFPVSIAIAQDIHNYENGSRFVPVYRDRYNFKLPDNHRLDASVDYKVPHKKVKYKWSLGVYNLYNKQNPTFIYFKPEAKDKYYTQFIPYSKVLLPFIPYFSLTLNW